ncbi:hypothetical protein AB0I98_44135 [Streptomyces sp. NPDC050211]|uniref:hypothetical protein n=1 Tax=Streptomyces sp. NPDC050211 TaxID=3154932 RepID=UPI00341D3D23
MVAALTVCAHSGQGCAIISRLLVPRGHHDEIVALVASARCAPRWLCPSRRRGRTGDPTAPGRSGGR